MTVAAVCAFLLFLALPARYAQSVRQGAALWATSVLPVALPSVFLTSLFARLPACERLAKRASPLFYKLFRVSGDGGLAAILSIVSGYPAGARMILDLWRNGRVSPGERLRVAALCTTCGPAFLVGAAGAGMAHSAAAGWILFLSHAAAVWSVGAVLRASPSAPSSAPAPRKKPGGLAECVSVSVLSVLTAGGAIALFTAFGSMAADALAPLALPPAAEAMVRGCIEMTAGCAMLLSAPSAFRLSLCAFLTTFGGLCVFVQQWCFLAPIGVRAPGFLAVKCAQGVLAALLCYLLARLAGFP